MASLSTSAQKTLRGLRRGPELPEWWPVLQIGLGALLVLGLGFAFIAQVSGSDKASPSVTTLPEGPPPQPVGPGASTVVAPTSVPATGPVETTVPGPDPDAPVFAEPTEPVGALGGSAVQVPSAALVRARAVLEAAGHPVDAAVTAVLVSPERVVFEFAAPQAQVKVTVSKGSGGWVASL